MTSVPGARPASTRQLREQGYAYDELAALIRAGALSRVRRGAYAVSIPESPEDRHRQLIAATLPQLAGDACVSHQSAAVLHGLPTWSDQLGLVHVTRPRANGGRRRTVTQVHPGPLAADDVVVLHGLAVTSLARTVADCSRTLSFSRAVAIGDAALRSGMRPEDLSAQLGRRPGRPGMPQSRRVAAFIDGRSESAGESLSRVLLRRQGLPTPQLQLVVLDRAHLEVARTDFGWEERRTLAEFDGRVKYGRLLRDGETAGDVIYREKVREDMLRDLGWEVVRWVWAELQDPALIVGRLQRAFARGTRR